MEEEATELKGLGIIEEEDGRPNAAKTELATTRELKEGEHVYRIHEKTELDDQGEELNLYDTTYPKEFCKGVLSEEEWETIIKGVNDIWRPAAIKQAELKLHSWQYSLICFLPWVIREEQKIEVFVQEKRKESVEYLHQVNVRYQDRGLLFDLREYIEQPGTFIDVYLGKVENKES